MKDRKPASKKLILLPLILGISSFFTFALYYYSANHAPYAYIDIIIVGPILSFIGVIISIVMRKSRKLYPTLWTSGLVICLLGFIICVLIIVLLIMIMAAAFDGTWLWRSDESKMQIKHKNIICQPLIESINIKKVSNLISISVVQSLLKL